MTQEALPQRIHDESNGLDYVLHGDYYLPDIVKPKKNPHLLGKWGRMHKRYLEENKPGLYSQLVLQGKLSTYLADLNEQAQGRLNAIISQMMRNDGVTEHLKAADQMQWVRRMNNIRQRAEEVVMAEMIYA